jgi:biopolymer transport protein ExbD
MRRKRYREEPEINFIPLIDLLLVILIFLLVTTTYSKNSEIEVNLPIAGQTEVNEQEKTKPYDVAISAGGEYALNGEKITLNLLALALAEGLKKNPNLVVVLNADAKTQNQNVVSAMEVARDAGITRLSFGIQQSTP